MKIARDEIARAIERENRLKAEERRERARQLNLHFEFRIHQNALAGCKLQRALVMAARSSEPAPVRK